MRTRRLLIALALGGAVLVLGAGPAHAVSEEELREECIHILEEGGNPEDCQEAPNPILPETKEIVAGALSFTILFLALYKLAFPAIRKAMDERSEKIRSDLDRADTAKSEAEATAAEYQQKLGEARTEAAQIMEEARQAADQYRDQRKSEADAEITELKERAAADVEAAKSQALADLRSEVADLAIGAAEQVVGRSLDRETNVALVEQYIDQVGADR